MKKIIFVPILLLLSSCRIIYPDIKYEPIRFGKYYFPTYDENSKRYSKKDVSGLWIIEPNDSLSKSTNGWYSKHLNSMGEPILFDKTEKNKEIIRFTHLGTWSSPHSYRIEKSNSKIIAVYNETNGLGGYKAGRRVTHKKKRIRLKKWELIVSKIDSIDFWNIQTHDPNMILDGEEWILEVLINQQYHFVTRNSPEDYNEKDYTDLCNLIKDIYNEE